MVPLGAGLGLISSPATEAIMGVLPTEKTGMGSAVNDATRELGGTLGVAVIGSVALSVYREGLETTDLPEMLIGPARESVGAALEAARQASDTGGEPGAVLAQQLSELAKAQFVDGLSTGGLVAAAVTAVVAVLTSNSFQRTPATRSVDDGGCWPVNSAVTQSNQARCSLKRRGTTSARG
ncbi:hypothetical protein HQO44_16120 [Rhodococcus fascians]|nr:hypothetical protein [Rhodococcus fascians]